MKRWFLFFVVLALAGSAAQYGVEGGYGAVQLRFSGQLVSAGHCQRPSQNVLRCQVPGGSPGRIELTATVTPSGYPVNISVISLPPWASFTPASGSGSATATCSFQPPVEAAGKNFQLVFRASTIYGLHVDLTVILEVVSGGPPSGPEYPEPGYMTDEEGRFSVPVNDPPNTWVEGVLTRCTRYPLAGVPVEVFLFPKPGRLTIGNLSDVGAVRISTPYGEATVTEFRLLSALDIYGRVTGTIDVGVVCLQPPEPSPGPPTGTITGTTDEEGRFSEPLPRQPGITVAGRLTECTVRPLTNQEFSLTPVYEGDAITAFNISVPGYAPVTATGFGRISLLGLTTYLLGDVCLKPEIDLLPWDEDRPLTWGDFRGQPPEDLESRDEAAFISYRFKIQKTDFTLTYDPKTRTWKAKIDPATLKVENLMDRSKSWVDPKRRSDSLLKHEQGHFDINEVYRRVLETRLRRLEAEAPTQKEAAEELQKLIDETFDQVSRKAEQVQADYDLETAHGQDQEAQRDWEAKIREWLADPAKAPQP
ncbi:MAG: hypothetical protein XD60_0416 [Acetothermia bacterium 64_32]|nr:MAG: hypothetical protein XD60_0416 [Acetothermia bacterium 64_32]HAF71019.1 hypothetical protein [Candidatus Acetothermia bacterium]